MSGYYGVPIGGYGDGQNMTAKIIYQCFCVHLQTAYVSLWNYACACQTFVFLQSITFPCETLHLLAEHLCFLLNFYVPQEALHFASEHKTGHGKTIDLMI